MELTGHVFVGYAEVSQATASSVIMAGSSHPGLIRLAAKQNLVVFWQLASGIEFSSCAVLLNQLKQD